MSMNINVNLAISINKASWIFAGETYGKSYSRINPQIEKY